MAQAKKNTTNSSESKKVKEMQKTIDNLTAMVQALINQSNNSINTIDRDVTFISLCSNTLNLSTEPYGAGTVYTFTEFGEEQSIPLSDARKIVKSNKSFIKGGKCYIADDELVSAEHLTNDYKKILGKDSLLELLNADRNKFKKVFDSLTDTQKEIFKDIVVNKMAANSDSVDMNIVQHINNSLGVDILEDIKYSKELFKNEE